MGGHSPSKTGAQRWLRFAVGGMGQRWVREAYSTLSCKVGPIWNTTFKHNEGKQWIPGRKVSNAYCTFIFQGSTPRNLTV